MKPKPERTTDTESGEKKPYVTPRLRRYGDIRNITRAISNVNMSDMANHLDPNQKT